MNNSKPFYQSWTLWFNFAIALVAFLTTVFQLFPVDPRYLVAVASFGNMLLRFKTIVKKATKAIAKLNHNVQD